jgi:molybdate transport system substrate-binding protein
MFKKITIILFIKVFLTLGFLFVTQKAQAIEQIEGAFERGLIVLASSSLTEAIHDIIKKFSIDNNISVSASFGSSNELAADIESGEPANIIISEDAARMRDLQRKGVLNVFSLTTLAEDRLALVLPKDHYMLRQIKPGEPIESKLKKVITNSIPVIPDPKNSPAGYYIKQTLETLGLWQEAKDKTIKAGNIKYALYLISKGKNSGIVYLSSIRSEDNVEVIGIIPKKYHDKIIYQMAIVAELGSSENLNDAEKFVEYLKSSNSKDILNSYNFTDSEEIK